MAYAPPVTDASLPVDVLREDVRLALDADRPLVVTAPTGSGKSTRLPLWLAEDVPGPVLVVEPRRVACRALAVWLAEQAGERVGERIGYRVRFEDRTSDQTQVVFATPGMALVSLIQEGPAAWGAILVDEFHERGWEVDLVVALVGAARRSGDGTRLVVCSATLDVEGLTGRLEAQLLQAEGRRFPVDVSHRGEGPPTSGDLSTRVAEAVRDALAQDRDGDVLVFLPGKREIEDCRAALARCDARLVSVHGGIPPTRLARLLGNRNERSVYLATNVAETSLTLPGVTTVVDAGLVRMRRHQAGRSLLALGPISRASMDQRAGRAGRVRPGRCVRLWSARYTPEEETPPEVARVDLDDLVIRAAAAGIDGARLEALPWVTPLPPFAVEQARTRLRGAGVLDGDGTLTPAGRIHARLPVSPDSAAMLVGAPPDLLPTLCGLAACVEVGRDLFLPRGAGADSWDDVQEARAELTQGATHEVEAQLRALVHGHPKRHGLHDSALAEARRISESLRRITCGGAPAQASFSDALIAHLLRAIPHAVFARRANRGKKRSAREDTPTRWGNGSEEISLRPPFIPGRDPEEQPPTPAAGVVLEREWLGVGRSARGVGRLLIPCPLEALIEAGLARTERGQLVIDRKGRSTTVLAETAHHYAGVEIRSAREPVPPDALPAAIGALVLEGRLGGDLGPQLLEELHVWGLLHQLGVASAPPKASSLVSERFEAMGLGSVEDLELVELADLCPDLVELAVEAGINASEPDRLRKDFPRTWALEGTVYSCSVRMTRREVTLEPIKIGATKRLIPPVARVPRFRGFSVVYRKASRVQRLR